MNIKKIFIILLFILVVGCAWAQSDSTIEINGTAFKLPAKYQGGELKNGKYSLDDEFSIQCIDVDISKYIGLWACEKDYGKNLTIEKHPVRHYYQYNEYVHDNQSHAYFASGKSIYEIKWTGNKITDEIENIIKSSPPSEIANDSFNSLLDESIDIYKQERIGRLNKDGEYNYLESKYNSEMQNNPEDNTGFKEILLTYYR